MPTLQLGRTSDSSALQDEFLEPVVKVQLRVERNGWLRSSALAATFVTGFMAVSLYWITRWDAAPLGCVGSSCLQSATRPFRTDPSAFTVALLGLVFLAVIRAGEHPYTARVLRSLRLVAITDALVPIAAAWLLVFPGPGRLLTWGWAALTVLSACATVVLLLAWQTKAPEGGAQ